MKIKNQASVRYCFKYCLPVITCIILFFCICLSSIAQVNNTGNMYVSGNVYANASFTNNAATGTAYLNDGTFYLTGDFTNNQASMSEGAGTTQFMGTSLQRIAGSQQPVFHHVYVDNSNGVQMNINTTMNGTISPITGSLYFNGRKLTMGGMINISYTNTSAFNVTATSDLVISGNAAAGNKLYFAPSAHTLHDLTVNTSSTGVLGNALDITAGSAFGTVTANGTFNALGYLTLKSDANGTARVASSAGTIDSNVTVERYIPPRRAWRFMAIPINNDTLHIRSGWQEGVNNPSLSTRYDPSPGYGTHITGDNNTSLGYDYNTTYNASIKTWVQSVNGWSTTAPPTVSTLINSYPGYCLFVRGSRAVDLAQATYAIADPTVLRLTGKLNNGTWSKNWAGVLANDWLLVGNPYASSIDISTMLSGATGVYSNKFWVWDPAFSGTYGVGGYVTYNNGIMAPLTTNYPAATTIIQGGQAFFVQSNTTSASISFHQNEKTASESDIFGRHSSPDPRVYINLMLPSADSLLLVDGTAALFANRFSAGVDEDDANKLPNFNESIALLRNEKRLAIETRPKPQPQDTLFFRMAYLKYQPYTLLIMPQYLNAERVQAWLIDKYLNTETPVNASDSTLYNFSATTDTVTYMRRFMIVYKKLPHTVTAKQEEKTVVANETAGASVFPNPVTDNNFILNLTNINAGDYTVNVYSFTGKLVLSYIINHSGKSSASKITLPQGLAAGNYNLNVISRNGNTIKSIPLVIGK